MEIGKYIFELLLENDTVIIPGFGAFVAQQKSAEFTETQLLPPSREISFSHEIRNNDGLLVGIIAEKENISHFDALKRIEKERDALQDKISNGERVTLAKVGVLYFAEEKIQFESENNPGLSLSSFGLEALELADFPTYEKETPEEETVVEPIPETVPEALPIEIPDEPEPVYTVVDNDEQEERKKRGWLWIVLILIPLGIASIFILNQQKNGEATINSDQDSTLSISVSPEMLATDSIVPDSTTLDSAAAKTQKDTLETVTVPAENTNTETSEMQQVSNDKPMYYLVGGSFKEKENAEKYMHQLKLEGFEPFYLGKTGSFFIVSIGHYETLNEASQAKDAYIEKNPGSGVWIKKE